MDPDRVTAEELFLAMSHQQLGAVRSGVCRLRRYRCGDCKNASESLPYAELDTIMSEAEALLGPPQELVSIDRTTDLIEMHPPGGAFRQARCRSAKIELEECDGSITRLTKAFLMRRHPFMPVR